MFGMTEAGGSSGDGSVFSVGTNGSGYQNLFSFTGGTNGKSPYGSLIQSGTTLFGMSYNGGSNGAGNVFSIGTNGSGYRNLLSFSGTNGENPLGGLILSGTTLFGMTESGGSSGDGNVFSIGTDGSSYRNLLSFSGTNGEFPYGSLVQSGSTLFGLTADGGSSGYGNVFSIGTDGSKFESLLSFSGTGGAYPGAYPFGDLTLIGGTLFGMTAQGGANNDGTVFALTTPEPSTLTLSVIAVVGFAGYLGRRRIATKGRKGDGPQRSREEMALPLAA